MASSVDEKDASGELAVSATFSSSVKSSSPAASSSSAASSSASSSLSTPTDDIILVKDDGTTGRNKGRKLIAGRAYNPGELVVETLPFVSVLHPNEVNTRCSFCFLVESASSFPAVALKRCSKCQAVKYCSIACQKQDFFNHKVECSAYTSLLLTLPDTVRMSILVSCRILRKHVLAKGDQHKLVRKEIEFVQQHRRLHKVEIGSQSGDCPSGSDSMLCQPVLAASSPLDIGVFDLQTNFDQLDNDTVKHYATIAHMADQANLVPPKISVEEMVMVQGQNDTNNFTIYDDNLNSIGTGVYPKGALLNHSCHPNCVLSYSPISRIQNIRCLRRIEPGDELTHMYIDVVASTEHRQRQLEEVYRFVCKCLRCDPSVSSFSSASSSSSFSSSSGEGTPSRSGGIVATPWVTLLPFPGVPDIFPVLDGYLNGDAKGLPLPNDALIQLAEAEYFHQLGRNSDDEEIADLLKQNKDDIRSDEAPSSDIAALRILQARKGYLSKAKDIRSRFVHPLGSCMLQSHSALLDVSLDLNDIASAFLHSLEIIAYYKCVLDSNHPLLGLQLYTVADIAQRLKTENRFPSEKVGNLTWMDIIKVREEALGILTVTHGKSNPLVLDLLAAIQEMQPYASE